LSAFGRGLARVVLKIGGWRVEGDRPAASSYVLIAAPHTSNWDFIWFIAMALVKDVPVRWLGKHTLFKGPLGYLMRALGGLPIERSSQQGYVAQIAGLFRTPEPVVLVFPAEGTRGRVPHWKSGFYHVARQAQVPVVLGFLDYARKCGGFGPEIVMTGNLEVDMDHLRAFYGGIIGRHPEKQGPIRLREEGASPPSAASA
jgi:1-acyl-sn-glycerol-3-phosphate acyltransferase